MASINSMIPAFHSELTKEAVFGRIAKTLAQSKALQKGLGGFGSGAGAGGIVGAGGGAVVGAGRGYSEAREHGVPASMALRHGVAGALGGAAKGAILGAGVGAAGLGGLRAAGKLRGASTSLAQMGGPLGAGARFGQRQVHGLTGWTPKGGIQSIRGGAYGAQKHVGEAETALRAAGKGDYGTGIIGSIRRKGQSAMGRTPREIKAKEVKRATKKLHAAEKGEEFATKAEQMGLTSLPGYAKALAKSPGKALHTGFGEQWHSGGPFSKAMLYGLPAGLAGKELATASTPGGPGRLERAGKELGYLAYGMGPLPIATSFLTAPALSWAGGQAGRLAGRLTGKKRPQLQRPPPPPSIDPAGGTTQPEEYMLSDRMTLGAQ